MNLKACEKCKTEFSCGAAAGHCWCMSVPLKTSTLEVLRKKYEDCLCETCLNAYRAEAAPE